MGPTVSIACVNLACVDSHCWVILLLKDTFHWSFCMTCTNDHYRSHSTTYTHTPQIEEMTVQPRVEQDLRVNRSEYGDMVTSLSSPVVPELCQLVMKLENTVAELANIAAENPGTLWWCVCVVWGGVCVVWVGMCGWDLICVCVVCVCV